MSAPRRGRRPGAPDTRASILAAAREAFAASGFGRTSVRSIAAAAGVDAALVHHYFGSKDDLFVAALDLRVDPREAVLPVTAGGPDGVGERLMWLFMTVWDDPEARLPLLALVRGVAEPQSKQLIRDGFLRLVLEPIGDALGVDEPERRLSHVASQLLGLVLIRYLLEVEPLASMPADQVVATYAPVVQGFLTAPLP
ncbi:TetR family transcriptional regulator [Nocardioides sp. cx-169]|uniref:TetR/AcrR family transcriptional regulator n=1 Tax=Nocardioides sp. cx-169 TaxID=2899080 RepID=UPI0027E210D5|nr:TetR family transcriptional regulator [Nocardioides sp. cx-169]